MVNKGSSPHACFTRFFETINQPLELILQLEFLAERQDPVLSIAFMATYWATLGILIGAFAFVVTAWRQRATKSRSAMPN